MKLSKLIREQKAEIANLNARLELARAEWQDTQDWLGRLKAKHTSVAMPSRYGPNSREMRCSVCTGSMWPCDEVRSLSALMDRRRA